MTIRNQPPKNNWFRWLIRAWIGLVSLAAFLFGWIFLGHSGKPVSAGAQNAGAQNPGEVVPLPTLAPLPPLNDGSSLSQQSSQQQQPLIQFARPSFRTRGS